MDNLNIEKEIWADGFKLIACIDEVGRGCLAGNVLACAVIMPQDIWIEGVTDSKKVSKKKRIVLSKVIKEKSIAYGFGSIEAEEIDRTNIKKATLKAMEMAIENIRDKNNIKIEPDILLIDAEKINKKIPQKNIIKGDLLCHGISCASILAKVERDSRMIDLTRKNKNLEKYDILNNKGYGTKKHIEALKNYGKTEFHRNTFLRKILSKNKQLIIKSKG